MDVSYSNRKCKDNTCTKCNLLPYETNKPKFHHYFGIHGVTHMCYIMWIKHNAYTTY